MDGGAHVTSAPNIERAYNWFTVESYLKSGHRALPALALTLIAIVTLWPYRNFSGDDAYITFRFVHNLSSGAGFSFNPGVPTYGSTAPLWVFMLTGLNSIGLDIRDGAHLLNWIFAIGSVLLFYQLAQRYLGAGVAAWGAAALLAVDPWFVRWSLSGLENALAIFLLTGVLLAQLAWRNTGRINWVAPIIACLSAFCRPEMLFLCVLVFADSILFERKRRTANLVVFMLVSLVMFAPWVWYTFSMFGSPVPNTVTAKASADHIHALTRVCLYFGSFWAFQAAAILAVCFIRPLRLIAGDRFQGYWTTWLLPISWGIALPVLYVAGGAPVAGRYMMFALPCYLLVGVAAWQIIWSKSPKAVIAAVLATIALMMSVQYRYCWYVTRWPQGIDPTMVRAAETLRSVSKPGDTVAANQIGALGYYSDRAILDTLGLVSPEVFPYRRASIGSVWKYVYSQRVAYVFDTASIDELTKFDPAYASLTLVGVFPVQREGASAAKDIRTYYLYKTNWEAT